MSFDWHMKISIQILSDPKATKNFVDNISESTIVDDANHTLLHYLARYGHYGPNNDLIKDLICTRKWNVNLQNNSGWTALMMASGYSTTDSSLKTVKTLLSVPGIDVNLQDNDGWTALMMASRHSNTDSSLETVKTLLSVPGIDVNLQNNDGWTALMMASRYSNTTSSLETVKTLLSVPEIDINLQINDGWTALMMVSKYSNTASSLETVKTLIKKGANHDILSHSGNSMWDYLNEIEKLDIRRHILAGIYNDKLFKITTYKRIPRNIWHNIIDRARMEILCRDIFHKGNIVKIRNLATLLEIQNNALLAKWELSSAIETTLSFSAKLFSKYKKQMQDIFAILTRFEDKKEIEGLTPTELIKRTIKF